jgi:hypothetical protein
VTTEKIAADRPQYTGVTDNDVAFYNKGDSFTLIREPHHSSEDIHKAKRLLRRDRKTVKAITVDIRLT